MSVTYFESTDKVTRANVNEKIDEINFQNGELDTKISNQETKINIARAGVELYSSNGTSGTITLSDNVSNYDYIEIHYKDNDNLFYSTKIYNPNGKNIPLNSISVDSNSYKVWWKCSVFVVSDTTLTPTISRFGSPAIKFAATGTTSIGNCEYLTNANIYILKVIGYKNNI